MAANTRRINYRFACFAGCIRPNYHGYTTLDAVAGKQTSRPTMITVDQQPGHLFDRRLLAGERARVEKKAEQTDRLRRSSAEIRRRRRHIEPHFLECCKSPRHVGTRGDKKTVSPAMLLKNGSRVDGIFTGISAF